MPRLKATHVSPTPEEDAAINAGIAADPDAPELDDPWFARAKPAIEVDPELVRHWRKTHGKASQDPIEVQKTPGA